jgi:AcrR family transcriptional regulator
VSRTKGSRNADYPEQRLALARRLLEILTGPGGLELSLRELSKRLEVSAATVKHYFQDRNGVLVAALEAFAFTAAPYVAMMGTPIDGDVKTSLKHLLTDLQEAWVKFNVGQFQGGALALGLMNPALGPRYINLVLEPLLQAAEARLAAHVERGDLIEHDVRQGALMLMSPLFFGLLHQSNLSGTKCRPLDVGALVDTVVSQFLAATVPGRRQAKQR